MANSKRSHGGRTATGRSKASGAKARKSGSRDAIALLKADHRQVEGWFAQFEKARSASRKEDLATRICDALKVHMTVEEELFYPAFLEATDDTDTHHEAEIEHEGARRLMGEIAASAADDDYFDAKVTVLAEMIKHHVKEEEQPNGMFAKARKSDMDLAALGDEITAKKRALKSEGASPARGSRRREDGYDTTGAALA
jgi:hypothetical protein